MKNVLLSLFAFICCSASATHFRPATAGAVKKLAHDDTNMYILHWNGLEVRHKISGKSVCYTQATGHIPCEVDPKLNALAVHGDTVWLGGNGFLTAIVGNDSQTWEFEYDYTITMQGHHEFAGFPMDFDGIAFDSKGHMYVGGLDLVGHLTEPGEIDFVGLPDIAKYGTEVWQMLVDKNDVLWVSYTRDFGDESLVKYSAEMEKVDAVSSNLGIDGAIKALAFDKDNNLWFGTSNSQKLFSYDGESVEEYDVGGRGNGWQYRGICCMSFDDIGRLWLLHSNSQSVGYDHYSAGPLCCLYNGELVEYAFPADVGNAYCLDVDGENVYVGTDKGVLKLVSGNLTLLDSPWCPEVTETSITDINYRPKSPHEIYDLQGRKRGSDRNVKGVVIKKNEKSFIHR